MTQEQWPDLLLVVVHNKACSRLELCCFVVLSNACVEVVRKSL